MVSARKNGPSPFVKFGLAFVLLIGIFYGLSQTSFVKEFLAGPDSPLESMRSGASGMVRVDAAEIMNRDSKQNGLSLSTMEIHRALWCRRQDSNLHSLAGRVF